MSRGKQAAQGQAAAAMAAGARLEAMRRRVSLSRVVVWTVCIAVASTSTTVAAAPAGKPTVVRTAAPAADPAG